MRALERRISKLEQTAEMGGDEYQLIWVRPGDATLDEPRPDRTWRLVWKGEGEPPPSVVRTLPTMSDTELDAMIVAFIDDLGGEGAIRAMPAEPERDRILNLLSDRDLLASGLKAMDQPMFGAHALPKQDENNVGAKH